MAGRVRRWFPLPCPGRGLADARTAGRPLKDLAEQLGISVATAKRALCPGYRAAPSSGSAAAAPPAIAAAPGPVPATWEEPRERRGRAWRDD